MKAVAVGWDRSSPRLSLAENSPPAALTSCSGSLPANSGTRTGCSSGAGAALPEAAPHASQAASSTEQRRLQGTKRHLKIAK